MPRRGPPPRTPASRWPASTAPSAASQSASGAETSSPCTAPPPRPASAPPLWKREQPPSAPVPAGPPATSKPVWAPPCPSEAAAEPVPSPSRPPFRSQPRLSSLLASNPAWQPFSATIRDQVDHRPIHRREVLKRRSLHRLSRHFAKTVQLPKQTPPVSVSRVVRDRKSTRLNSSHLGISY